MNAGCGSHSTRLLHLCKRFAVPGLEAHHGGGSGPPRNGGMGRWGWGAGGDGGGDGGEEERGHVERAGDLTALGAAQVRRVSFFAIIRLRVYRGKQL